MWIINSTKFKFCLKDLQLKQKINKFVLRTFEKIFPNYDKIVGHGMDRSISKNKMVAHPSFELLQKFLCLIFQGKGFCIKIQLALLNKPNLRSSPRETEPDSLGRGSGQHINLSQILQSSVMKKQVPPFYGQCPSFYFKNA